MTGTAHRTTDTTHDHTHSTFEQYLFPDLGQNITHSGTHATPGDHLSHHMYNF